MAAPKRPARDELLAAAVVTTVMGCTARFVDVGGTTELVVDWELSLPDGTGASLEISRITDPKLRDLSAAAASEARWELTTTRYSWQLGVEGRIRLKRFRKEYEQLLTVLERNDVVSLAEATEGEAAAAAAKLLELGVVTAVADDRSAQTTALVYPSWPWRTIDPGLEVNNRVAREAGNNSDKFALRNETNGHLFLWADALAFSVTGSLLPGFTQRYITTPPELPEGISVVWLAPDPYATQVAGHPVWPSSSPTTEELPDAVRCLWRVEPPGHWDFIGQVPLENPLERLKISDESLD
jgi:hypothetical protein